MIEWFECPSWCSGRDAHWLHRPAEPHGDTGQRSVLQQRAEAAEGHQPWQGVLPLRTQRHLWLRNPGPRHPRDSCDEGAFSLLLFFSSSPRPTVIPPPPASAVQPTRAVIQSARNASSWVNLALDSMENIKSFKMWLCWEFFGLVVLFRGEKESQAQQDVAV